jgi:predicted nucleic acid-binding protein
MLTVARLFDFCADVELRNARVYADFMLRLGNEDDRVAQFWEEMSTAEWEHYIVLHFGRRLCERAQMLHNAVRDISEETLRAIDQVLAYNEERVKGDHYTLEDAFDMAIRFESSEADAIYLGLVAQIKRAIERLGERHLLRRIERMETQVSAHLEGLVKAITRLTDNPSLARRAREVFDMHPGHV